ncbi:DUF4224 domain-containing protein [Stenotrophomonas sp. VV52]|uniref:DUF4224 domain-containing protein n=1 Tax=Stenotrophomonas sp. VV52 TaxID=2066958 RepID=UPI000C9E8231|nr:DUF4224 domain-containing protein [Stenotrophomonas sp. VV52]
MADSPYLSRDDIKDLCRTPQRKRQAAFLIQNGIRHYLDAHGWPVVLWSAIEGTPEPKKAPAEWKPNKAA